MRGIRGVRVAKGASKAAEKKVQKPEVQQEEKPQPQPQLGASLFGVKSGGGAGGASNPFANPFSSGSNGAPPSNPFASGGGSANPFAKPPPEADTAAKQTTDEAETTLTQTFADKVRLSSPPPSSPQPARPHEPWPEASAFPPAYPHFYLDAEYETLDAPSTPEIPANARMDVDAEGSSSSGGGKEDKEIFESSLDKTFQKFADRVGQNPEQVLRYEFQGKPLLYSDADAVGKLLAEHGSAASNNAKVSTAAARGSSGLPRCGNCGAERVFEVQLTPHAITELEADEASLDGMEWGTILFGSCSADCKPGDVPEGEVGYVEDWIGVQWEEVAPKK